MRPTWLCVLLVAACTGQIDGIGEAVGDNQGVTDGTAPDAGAMISPADATAIACDQPVTTSRNGKHNAGQACLACHDGGDAARFTVGGTLYSGVASTTPVVGATIHVTDSMGTNAVLVTATNGNFWTTQTLAFPLTVRASRCPDSKPMVSPVTQTGGSCNLSGCHTAGFRIHLP